MISEEKKTKQCLIDCEYIIVEEKKVECCKVEDQNDIGYEEVKMLMSVKAKKETEIIEDKIECEIIEDRKVDYYELTEDKKDEEFSRNGLKYEEIKKLLSIILKKEEDKYLSEKNGVEYEEIKKLMYVITKKEYSKYGLEYDEIIEEKIECCRIEEKNDELIRNSMLNIAKKDDEIIDDKKVEDIRMLKSSRKLVLPKRILKVIARERGVKNYENLPKSELIKEINKLKAAKELKKITFEKYKGDDLELKRKDIRESFRVKKKKKILLGKKKDVLKRLARKQKKRKQKNT